jgi:methylated-DNA-protein-cysteine methyltransferase-like protein
VRGFPDALNRPGRMRRAASGTHARILAVVRRIPRGRVATYGQVAALAGLAGRPRLAGYALHALPAGSPLPWHRVLGAGGRLTLVKLDPAAALTQRLRLEREGVRFDARGHVDMEACAWRPLARGSAARTRARGPGARKGRSGVRGSRRAR